MKGRQQGLEYAFVLALVKHRAPDFAPTFRDWLVENWATWRAFAEAANAVKAKGKANYSAYVIVNVLRWRADADGLKFALSNTIVPDLARLYNLRHGALFTTSTRFGKGKKYDRDL